MGRLEICSTSSIILNRSRGGDADHISCLECRAARGPRDHDHASKVSISALVVVGVKEIITTGKMHDEMVSVQAVIKYAMASAGYAKRSADPI